MATFTNNATGTFTKCPGDTYELVIGANGIGLYLQAKIGSMLGKKADEILLGTPMTIKAPYINSEGVIPAMQTEKGFIKGLRIDLQKAQLIGGKSYATFQIQWGTGMVKTGGAFAGALMLTNTLFSVGDLHQALEKSAATLTYWRIDP